METRRKWESETKSYSTWINLSARAALSYGFPATGGGGRAKAQDRRRGETDKNHLSLMQWTISISRGHRSKTREPAGEDPEEDQSQSQLLPGEESM